jgi:photosystem II stability/assembly factor-like uncharacterized protein
MKSFILLAIIFVGTFSSVWAQLPWQQVHSFVPWANAFYSIVSDSAYVYAYSMENSSGRLFRSASMGAPGTWTEITSDPNNMTTWGAQLYKSGQYLYLLESICYDAVLHRSADSGITWTIPDPSFGQHVYFSQLHFLSDTNILAVGDSATDAVYRSTDHGNSWKKVLNVPGGYGISASILGKGSEAYVILDSSVHISNDYGATWTSHSTLPYISGRTILLGDGTFLRSSANMLYTSTDAINWTVKPTTGLPAGLNFTASLQKSPTSDSLFWILTDYSTDHELLYSADNGATWGSFDAGLTIPSQAQKNFWVYDLHISTNGHMYVSVQSGGIYRTWPDYTSVADAENDNSIFRMYPNPADNTLHISMQQQPRDGSVTISDMLGKVVLSQLVSGKGHTDISIDISTLPPGVYTARLSSGEMHSIQKFVKR